MVLFLFYHLARFVPLLFLAWKVYNKELSNDFILLFLAFYFVLYRPAVDGLRIIQLGLVSQHEQWKAFIPFYSHFKWRRELLFKR